VNPSPVFCVLAFEIVPDESETKKICILFRWFCAAESPCCDEYSTIIPTRNNYFNLSAFFFLSPPFPRKSPIAKDFRKMMQISVDTLKTLANFAGP